MTPTLNRILITTVLSATIGTLSVHGWVTRQTPQSFRVSSYNNDWSVTALLGKDRTESLEEGNVSVPSLASSIGTGISSRRFWLSSITAATAASVTAMGCSVASPLKAEAEDAPSYFSQKAPISTQSTCDPSVSVWTEPGTGRRVYILGTAHISAESAVLAGEVVKDVRPEAVFVELDAKRVQRASGPSETSGSGPDSASSLDAFAVPVDVEVGPSPDTDTSTVGTKPSSGGSSRASKGNDRMTGVTAAAVGSAIKGMYQKLDSQGFQSGEEFVVAVKEGYNVGAKIILGDRDVEITLRRLSEALRQTDIFALLKKDSEMEKTMAQLVPASKAPAGDSDATDYKEQFSMYVENMKAKENVKVLMGQLKRTAPELYQAMVGERDEYMGNGLNRLSIFPNIVAVMGMAHVDGVEHYLQDRGWKPVPLMCKVERTK